MISLVNSKVSTRIDSNDVIGLNKSGHFCLISEDIQLLPDSQKNTFTSSNQNCISEVNSTLEVYNFVFFEI